MGDVVTIESLARARKTHDEPRMAGSHWKLEETGMDSSPGAGRHLDEGGSKAEFRLPVSQIVSE